MQNLLLGYFHYPNRPYLVRVLSVESLVHCAHGSLAQLLCETVGFVGIIRQKHYFFYVAVELVISQQSVFGDLLFLLHASNDLDHDLRVLLYDVFANLIFSEQFRHLGGQPLDTERTIEVDLQMHFVLEVGGSEWQ